MRLYVLQISSGNCLEFLKNYRSQFPHSWASILCTSSKTRFLLLIGSNDQTHLIDPHSLSDMNYQIMIVLIALFVFGYRLPVTNSRQKHYQQHAHPIKKRTSNTRSPNHVFQLQRLFSSSHWRWYSNLGNHVAFAQKNGTSTHLAWQHCHDFEFQIREAKPKNCATLGGRSIEYIFSYDEICLHICCAWIQQRSINFVLGLMCWWKSSKEKIANCVSPLRAIFQLIGLGGFQSGTVGGRV